MTETEQQRDERLKGEMMKLLEKNKLGTLTGDETLLLRELLTWWNNS